MKWTSDDVRMAEKFIEIKNRGLYCDGGQLTEVYNRVLDRKVNPTNCGSCIRQRINELEAALNRFKELDKELKEQEVNNVENAVNLHSNSLGCLPQEENKAVRSKKSKK